MYFLKKYQFNITLSVFFVLALSLIKCGHEASRKGVLPGVNLQGNGSDTDLGKSKGSQLTTLTDMINSGDQEQSQIAKEIFIKKTFNEIIKLGLEVLVLPIDEVPWVKTEELFKELGANPKPAFTQTNRVHVYSTKSVNGIRYLNAGFNVTESNKGKKSIDESHFSFEVENFDNNFETTINFLKESFLGKDAKPCLDTLQDHLFFKKDDFLFEIFKETDDTIDLNSVYPPRSLEDVGVVRVSISKGGHYHHLDGSCNINF